MPDMWWWVSAAAVLFLAVAYLAWLSSRVNRLHRRASSASAALDAALVRRAAAAAVLAEELAGDPAMTDLVPAGDLYATARAALDATAADREMAENDLTRTLRRLTVTLGPGTGGLETTAGDGADLPARVPSGWPAVVTASRRVGLARQVHTDLVRDARALRGRPLVRVLGLARRHPEPEYFDIDDPALALPRPQVTLADQPARR
jgi:hypothetical protein